MDLSEAKYLVASSLRKLVVTKFNAISVADSFSADNFTVKSDDRSIKAKKYIEFPPCYLSIDFTKHPNVEFLTFKENIDNDVFIEKLDVAFGVAILNPEHKSLYELLQNNAEKLSELQNLVAEYVKIHGNLESLRSCKYKLSDAINRYNSTKPFFISKV